MSKQNGGIIGPDNVTTGGFSGVASGVFKLGEVTKLIRESKWPKPSPFTNTVPNSCRFNNASSDNLSLSGSSGGSTTKFTRSFWIKRSKVGDEQYLMDNSGETQIFFLIQDSDKCALGIYASGAYSTELISNQVFRDTSAWYHFVIAVDYTNSTQAYRARIYVNGVEITSFSTETRPGNTSTTFNTFNSSKTHYISSNGGGNHFLGGYLAEVVHIDGQQLTPTSFGETNSASGIWVPKAITGLTFGTKGFHLDFKNSSALGNDVSGNNLDYTANNLTSLDQTTDTPSNNFSTMNSLDNYFASSVFSNGDLTLVTNSSARTWNTNTIGVTSGKWYCEMKSSGVGAGALIGIIASSSTGTTDRSDSDPYAWVYLNGGSLKNNGSSQSGTWASWANNDLIGMALDLDNNKIYFSKNGVWQNTGTADPSTGTDGFPITAVSSLPASQAGNYFIISSDDSTSNNATFNWNFGNPTFAISSGNADSSGLGNFEYAVPTGYLSLCTNNLNL